MAGCQAFARGQNLPLVRHGLPCENCSDVEKTMQWRTVFKKEGRSAHNGSVFSNYTVAHRKELMKAGILQEEECENGLEGAGESTIPSR